MPTVPSAADFGGTQEPFAWYNRETGQLLMRLRYLTGVLEALKGLAVGPGQISTVATDGFLYIPTCAGAPTGIPAVGSGYAAVVFDSDNDRLYVYNPKTEMWKSTTLA